jgi:hypothetical protein
MILPETGPGLARPCILSHVDSSILALVSTAVGGAIAAVSGTMTAVVSSRLSARHEREMYDRQHRDAHATRLAATYVELLRIMRVTTLAMEHELSTGTEAPAEEPGVLAHAEAMARAYGSEAVWRLIAEYDAVMLLIYEAAEAREVEQKHVDALNRAIDRIATQVRREIGESNPANGTGMVPR